MIYKYTTTADDQDAPQQREHFFNTFPQIDRLVPLGSFVDKTAKDIIVKAPEAETFIRQLIENGFEDLTTSEENGLVDLTTSEENKDGKNKYFRRIEEGYLIDIDLLSERNGSTYRINIHYHYEIEKLGTVHLSENKSFSR